MKKKILLLFMALISVIFIAGCGSGNKEDNKEVNSKVEIKVLNVGQGDSILIKSKRNTILFDTSDLDENENFKRELKKANVKRIDKLIITHAHADHLGGAKVLFRDFEVVEVYDNGVPATTNFYRNYLKEIKKQKIKHHILVEDEVLDLGDGIKLKVFYPTKDIVAKGGKDRKGKVDHNNSSIVGKLTYGNFSIMLTGDVESEGEKEIVKKYGDDLQCDVLKSAHHGSKSSSCDKFLKTIKADAVIISCGMGNDYGHPHSQVLKRYQKAKLDVYRTDVDGTITISTDGKTYKIVGEKK